MAMPNINTEMGNFAKVVLIVGQFASGTVIVNTFLSDAREVNQVRGMLGYTLDSQMFNVLEKYDIFDVERKPAGFMAWRRNLARAGDFHRLRSY